MIMHITVSPLVYLLGCIASYILSILLRRKFFRYDDGIPMKSHWGIIILCMLASIFSWITFTVQLIGLVFYLLIRNIKPPNWL